MPLGVLRLAVNIAIFDFTSSVIRDYHDYYGMIFWSVNATNQLKKTNLSDAYVRCGLVPDRTSPLDNLTLTEPALHCLVNDAVFKEIEIADGIFILLACEHALLIFMALIRYARWRRIFARTEALGSLIPGIFERRL